MSPAVFREGPYRKVGMHLTPVHTIIIVYTGRPQVPIQLR
jgi:hypothetical protein